jgi:hypothetical protein
MPKSSAEDFIQALVDAQNAGKLISENMPFDVSMSHTDEFMLVADRERYTSLWPLLEIFKDKTTEPMSIVNAYVEPIVKEAIEKRTAKLAMSGTKVEGDGGRLEELDDEEDTVLDTLVKQTSGAPLILFFTS